MMVNRFEFTSLLAAEFTVTLFEMLLSLRPMTQGDV